MSWRQRWLSEFPGRVIRFHCPRCSIVRRYDVDGTLAKMGDHNLAGMRVILAEAEKCPRVYSLSKWDVCRMECDVEDEKPGDTIARMLLASSLDKAGIRIVTDMRFDELQEWHVLYGACRCGRIRSLDRQKFTSRYGSAKMDDVAKKMRCRRCGQKGDTRFAIATVPR